MDSIGETSHRPPARPGFVPRFAWLALPLALFAILVGQKLASPDDHDILDQGKMSLYVLDIYHFGHWLVPLERGVYETTKPPLEPWLATIAAYAAGGPTMASMRVPPVLAALGVLLLTLALGRRVGSRGLAAIAGVVLVTSFLFLKLATLARPDMLHAFFTTSALYFAAIALERDEAGSPSRGPWLGMFAAMGLASLAKSPVSIGLLTLTLVINAWLAGGLARLRRIPFASGLALTAAIALAWLVPALIRDAHLWDVLFRQELHDHLVGDGENMGRPVYYLIPHFLKDFLPWTVFLAVGAFTALRSLRSPAPVPLSGSDAGRLSPSQRRLFLASLLSTLIVFSLPAQKRSDYVLPCWPAAALLVADVVLAETGGRILTGAALCAAAIAGTAGLGLVIGAQPLPGRIPEPYHTAISARHASVGAALLLAAAGAFAAGLGSRARRPFVLVAGLALATGVGLALDFGWFSKIALSGRGRAIESFCSAVRARERGGARIVVSDVTESILVALDRAGVPPTATACAEEVAAGRARYLVADRRGLASIRAGGFEAVEIDRTRPFLSDEPGEAFFLIAIRPAPDRRPPPPGSPPRAPPRSRRPPR